MTKNIRLETGGGVLVPKRRSSLGPSEKKCGTVFRRALSQIYPCLQLTEKSGQSIYIHHIWAAEQIYMKYGVDVSLWKLPRKFHLVRIDLVYPYFTINGSMNSSLKKDQVPLNLRNHVYVVILTYKPAV